MAEFIFMCLYSLILWVVLFPPIVVLATPIIFILVVFKREGTFIGNTKNEYRKLWKLWTEWGVYFVPW
jgi:hypothetical protein